MLILPRFGLVMRNIKAAVVAEQNVIVILRVDPDGVVIAVRNAAHCSPRLAAVDGLEERRAALIRNRVDADLAGTSSGRPGSTGTSRSCRCRRFARCRSSSDRAGAAGCRVRRRIHPLHRRAHRAAPRPSSFTPAPVPPLGPTSIDAYSSMASIARYPGRYGRSSDCPAGRSPSASSSRLSSMPLPLKPQGCRRRW